MTQQASRSLPKQFRFEQPKSPPVVVNFNGGQVTSDAGLSLIAELDRKLQITSRLAGCFQDYRQANRMLHPIKSLIAQRIYGLIMGYEDLNDHEELRHDPMFALALEKRIGLENEPAKLAGKSTLNRLEHEYGVKGTNIRFIVTSIPTNKIAPGELYTQKYCLRGEMENRFKEQQLELFSDRTSTHAFAGNQLRLWFSSIAYVLMNALRSQCLAKTELETAQVGTIRTKLLKLGALITVSARRILIVISSSSPSKHIFAAAYRCLKMLPNTA